MIEQERLLKVPEVAGRLGISKSAVYVLLNRGEIDSVAIYGRLRRISERSLEAYIDRKRAER